MALWSIARHQTASAPASLEPHQIVDNPVDGAVLDDSTRDISEVVVWARVASQLDESELTDFTVMVGDAQGIRFIHNKGDASPWKAIRIASASKWVTATLMMMLVDEGELTLASRPGDTIDWWTVDPADTRSSMTLIELLSFTSGFGGEIYEPLCINLVTVNLEDCVQTIYDDGLSYDVGDVFDYGPKHMQITALMAAEATGSSWNELWRRYIAEPLEIAPTALYDFPSLANPLASGGLSMSASDYARFLQHVVAGDLVEDPWGVMNLDLMKDATDVVNHPIDLEGQEWHYSLGHWLECEAPFHDGCVDDPVLSSPGAFGFYPWVVPSKGYWGLIARDSEASVTQNPVALESVVLMQSLRADIELAIALGE